MAYPLALHRLTLTDFRCYQNVVLETDADIVVLVGANGAGKTNVLEAISLLAPGRGLRGASFSQLGRQDGTGGWGVAASVLVAPGDLVEIGTGQILATPDTVPRGRVCRVNHELVSGSSVLGEFVRIAWLTPALDRLFTESASARRRFLDRIVLGLDPHHGGRVRDYERAMATRNRLLKEGGDRRWLDAAENTMAECGVALARGRRACVGQLQDLLVTPELQGSSEASFFPAMRLVLEEGISGIAISEISSLEKEEEILRTRLHDQRERDARAGRTLEGPHRSDLLVFYKTGGGTSRDISASSCSTGEQKALVISLVLAHARLLAAGGVAPLVLLDEVAAHLDEQRRTALFQAATALGGQVWITGCDRSLFGSLESESHGASSSGKKADIFTVDEGRIFQPDGVR
ncbi:MAG: DNA replication/repair protein RecF [Parvularculales bacterium]